MQYSALSQIYDELMVNVDYKMWGSYLEELIIEQGEKPLNILELGCGSGNVTLELLNKGYEVVGIDYSEEMLEIARAKTEEFADAAIYIQQDLREIDFEIYEIDTVISANDTFNYITKIEEVEHILAYLHPRLKKGGQLVFDISSQYKLENVLGNNTYGESFDDMVYLWENFYDKEEKLINMEINFFEKTGKSYERFSETHIQKAYTVEEITNILQKTGYENIKVHADFNKEEGFKEDSQRIFFSCRK
ncbi:MAG: methyltransferase domain-containing protein [Proteocatella sp.]